MLIIHLPVERVEGLAGHEKASACTPEDVRRDRSRHFTVDCYSGPGHTLAVQDVKIIEEAFSVHTSLDQQISLGKELIGMT